MRRGHRGHCPPAREPGHEVVEAAPAFDALELWTKYTTLLGCLVSWAVADWARRLGREPGPEYFEPFVWAFNERGRGLLGADYLLAMQDVQREVRALSRFYETHDLWLTTTLGQPPVPLGTLVYTGDRRVAPAHGTFLALHLPHQRDWSAGDFATPRVECERSADRAHFTRATAQRTS